MNAADVGPTRLSGVTLDVTRIPIAEDVAELP
jgi:hypothetical protein